MSDFLPEVGPVSIEAVDKLRTLRRLQKVSAQALADRVTDLGFPVTRTMIANMESGRKVTLPLDYAALACNALGTDIGTLLSGPVVCPTCKGEPPAGFTCNTCGVAG